MLCRACGADMIATEYCSSCNEAVLWKCTSCEKENDKSVHTYHPHQRQESSRTVSFVGTLVGLASGLYTMAPV
jgi:predicted amidophosphoribosyltransferase